MKFVKGLFLPAAVFLAVAALAGCSNSAISPDTAPVLEQAAPDSGYKDAGPAAEAEPDRGTPPQTPDIEPFTVTISINEDGSARFAAGPSSSVIGKGGICNFVQLVVIDPNEGAPVVHTLTADRQAPGQSTATLQVQNLQYSKEYEFLLLMGHWERNYSVQGSYAYIEDHPPTLLVAGYEKASITPANNDVNVQMYPLVVDTKFKTTNTNITVNTVDDGIFSLLPESWKIEWTVGGKDGNGFTDLEAARKTASLFKDPIARVGTGAAKTSGINGPNGRVITLNLGALQVENEGSANFNLKYVPFSLNSADKWTGFNALNKQNGLPVWIIRNGINDQAQNSNTDFSSPGTDWAGTKNGNGAVAFKVKTTAVTGITLDKTSLSVAAGQTFTLVPTITPANATNTKVTWSSDTKSVATVNSSTGLVTVNTGATATATTTITATTQDGNKTAECLVTVIIPVTDIENVPTGTDYVAAKYQGFTKYIVKPYNATYQTVGWSVKNGGGTGAYFDGDTLFVSNWGTVTVTATIANGKGLQDYTQDFDILFRDRILITSLTIDDITIYISQHGGLPSAAYHVQPPDADTDILWDMLYTPDTQGIVDFHKTKDVGVDHWEGLQVGKTRVWTWFRQFPQIPGCYFNLTVVN